MLDSPNIPKNSPNLLKNKENEEDEESDDIFENNNRIVNLYKGVNFDCLPFKVSYPR